jgi:hypothetical protein
MGMKRSAAVVDRPLPAPAVREAVRAVGQEADRRGRDSPSQLVGEEEERRAASAGSKGAPALRGRCVEVGAAEWGRVGGGVKIPSRIAR